MKKLLPAILLVGTVACHSSGPPSSAPRPAPAATSTATGASTPREAVDLFFTSVRAQDIQAVGSVWGTAKGAARDNLDRTELEKRAILLQCYFNHDSYTVGAETMGNDGQRVFKVSIARGKNIRTPSVYTVQGPRGRWYVQDLEIAAVRDFCGPAKS